MYFKWSCVSPLVYSHVLIKGSGCVCCRSDCVDGQVKVHGGLCWCYSAKTWTELTLTRQHDNTAVTWWTSTHKSPDEPPRVVQLQVQSSVRTRGVSDSSSGWLTAQSQRWVCISYTYKYTFWIGTSTPFNQYIFLCEVMYHPSPLEYTVAAGHFYTNFCIVIV